MAKWAASYDPILQRYGIGALARLAVLNPASYDAVKSAGGLDGLVHGLTCSDPAAQCFAAGAIGKCSPVSPCVNIHMCCHALPSKELCSGLALRGLGIRNILCHVMSLGASRSTLLLVSCVHS
jgi:hypothetical protein